MAETARVNVSVWPALAVACQRDPAPPVALVIARGQDPAVPVDGAPQRLLRVAGAGAFPSLEFNDVPTSPGTRDVLLSVVEGRPTGNVWVHAADPRTILPHPPTPTGYAPAPPAAVDVRIAIVWPHDGTGAFAPVERATHVNVAIDLFAHGTTWSVPLEATYPVQLWWARGNEPIAPAPVAVQKLTQEVHGQVYPRWVAHDVPVEPGVPYHFLATVGPMGPGGTSYPTIWTHATDARTFLPQPAVPPACVP